MDNVQIYGIIYLATCTKNNKKYVGQTYSRKKRTIWSLLESRKRKHIAAMQHGAVFPFHNALHKYGIDCFTWSILCVSDSVAELNRMETECIISLNTMVKNGYNAICIGGQPLISDETKERMSIAAKNRWAAKDKRDKVTAEIRAGKDKHKDANKIIYQECAKRMHSAEARAKAAVSIKIALNKESCKILRSITSKGMWANRSEEERLAIMSKAHHSPTRKQKVAAALQTPEYKAKASKIVRAWRAREFEVLDAKTNQPIKTYQNIIEAANELKVCYQNISACLHGKARTFGHKKYKARFKQGFND